jgi:DNA-binding MarR family transcriptional regulator
MGEMITRTARPGRPARRPRREARPENVLFPCRPSDTFGFRLWQIVHAWQRRLEDALAALDLTHMQFVALATVGWLSSQGETPNQNRIAAFAKLDRMMLSKILRLLETKGYVARNPHPTDRRAIEVELSSTGWTVLHQAIPLALKTQAAFFGRLGRDGTLALSTQLDRLMAFEGCGG